MVFQYHFTRTSGHLNGAVGRKTINTQYFRVRAEFQNLSLLKRPVAVSPSLLAFLSHIQQGAGALLVGASETMGACWALSARGLPANSKDSCE